MLMINDLLFLLSVIWVHWTVIMLFQPSIQRLNIIDDLHILMKAFISHKREINEM